DARPTSLPRARHVRVLGRGPAPASGVSALCGATPAAGRGRGRSSVPDPPTGCVQCAGTLTRGQLRGAAKAPPGLPAGAPPPAGVPAEVALPCAERHARLRLT